MLRIILHHGHECGGDGKAYAAHPDYRGAPIRLNGANGAMVWDWQASGPWADVSPLHYTPGLSAAFPFHYRERLPGQFYDDETDMNYNGARIYNMHLGRFNQPDPVLQLDGLNSYNIDNNNPVGFVDPDGRQALAAGAIAARAAVVAAGRCAASTVCRAIVGGFIANRASVQSLQQYGQFVGSPFYKVATDPNNPAGQAANFCLGMVKSMVLPEGMNLETPGFGNPAYEKSGEAFMLGVGRFMDGIMDYTNPNDNAQKQSTSPSKLQSAPPRPAINDFGDPRPSYPVPIHG
ncbi:MAG: RHS repeat-associated core domain-containing protein [Alphaproteobacteria bacterium]|nr:MAG: RHS repeat-associated core domain-containing protein [Alphaproteobacteria bacterium]